MARPIAVYRTMVRTINQVFKNDTFALATAKAELRGKYQESAQVSDPIQIDLLCDEAIDVAGFMKDHVVQAELNERGNYGMQLETKHAEVVVEEPDTDTFRPK